MAELSVSTVLATLLTIFLVARYIKFTNAVKALGNWPGYRCPYLPLSLLGALLPPTRYTPGSMMTWKERLTLYQKFGTDVISVIPLLQGSGQLYIANLDVVKQVVAGGIKSPWIRPERGHEIVAEWGTNLFVAEREVWQRHRKIIGPAFNTTMYNMVWEHSVKFYQDMMQNEGWLSQASVVAHPIQKYTSKLAFLVIAACGFGMHTSYLDGAVSGEHSEGGMPISEALRVETTPSILKFLPRWVLKLPFKTPRRLATAHALLDMYMHAQVDERRAEVKTQIELGEESARDIFTLLVRASEWNSMSAENHKLRLTDSELIGNVFLLLFAGHETTAHTLAATFALLAVHPELQEEIYQQIMDVVGPDRIPDSDDYHKLDKVLAAFYEAARMFPAVYVMIREATEDTQLVVPTSFGEGTTTLAVPKGTMVLIDTIGMQYNPRYYPDPDKFIPSRWEGADKGDAVTAFSVGPRNCIGRRFATTESVAFLTMCLRDWRLAPALDSAAGETQDAWCKRVLDARLFLTLGVKDAPIRMTRRTRA